MKRFLMAMACGLLWAGVGLVTGGCEDELSPNWEFQNHSGYRVYLAPNGQDWSPATVGPGGKIEVNYNGERIQYIFTPSNTVRAEGGDGRTIHLYNR